MFSSEGLPLCGQATRVVGGRERQFHPGWTRLKCRTGGHIRLRGGKDESALPLFQSALRFFEQLAERWPAEQLLSNLNTLVAEVPSSLSKVAPESVKSDLPVLLSNLEETALGAIGRAAARPSFAYFCPVPVLRCSSVTGGFRPGFGQGPERLTLYTQNGITTLTKAWLGVPAFIDGDMEIRLCRYADEEHFQQLHGKAYAFTCGKEVVLAMGSANFTSAALRRTATNGNLEVLLCYPPADSSHIQPG